MLSLSKHFEVMKCPVGRTYCKRHTMTSFSLSRLAQYVLFRNVCQKRHFEPGQCHMAYSILLYTSLQQAGSFK